MRTLNAAVSAVSVSMTLLFKVKVKVTTYFLPLTID